MYENNNQFPNDLDSMEGKNNSNSFNRGSYMDVYSNGTYSCGSSDSNRHNDNNNYDSDSSHVPSSYSAPNNCEAPSSYSAPNNCEAPNAYSAPNNCEAPSSYSAPNSCEAPNAYNSPNSCEAPNAYSAPNNYGAPNNYNASNAYGTQNSYYASNSYGAQNNTQTINPSGAVNSTDAPNSQHVTDSNKKSMRKKLKKKKTVGGFKKVLKFAGGGVLFGACAGVTLVGILYVSPVREQIKKLYVGSEETIIEASNEIEKSKVIDTTVNNNISTTEVVSDVSNVVEQAMPCVVSITGMYKVENTYDDFFGNYFGFPSQEQEEEGSGSGIIVGKNDEELLIVTNNHVVQDATSLAVQFIDGETVNAQIKGTEYAIDLAVIAVPLADVSETTFSEIKIATLGDSDNLKVGEVAIAIGNALGYGQSVTTGVISAVDREYTQEDTTNFLIQTDAAINPGNSGGALLNMKGEVVGINSSKIAGNAVEGMGYAIPISTAKPIIEELMTKQTRTKVSENQKAFLGISGINVTEDVQQNYGLPEGIYIAQVHENTAAANAGLKKGDILVEFDGEKVETLEELTSLLEYYKKGTTVEVVIMQGSPNGYQEKTITVTLGGRTDS